MKKEIILFLIMWPGLFAIAGQNSLAVGINGSKFADTKSESKIGFSIDFTHEWTVSMNVGINTGLRYLTRGAGLENKIMYPPHGDYYWVKNINCRMTYVAFPLCLRTYLPWLRRNIYFQFGLAPALSISDGSSSKILDKIEISSLPEEFNPEDADYGPNQYGTFGKFQNSVTMLESAVGIKFHSYAVQAHVSYDYWGEADVADGIASMNHKFFTIGIQVYWIF